MVAVDLVHAAATENRRKFVPVPVVPFGDQPQGTAQREPVESLFDEVPGNSEVGVVGRVRNDLGEAGFTRAPEAVGQRDRYLGHSIRIRVLAGDSYSLWIVVDHEHAFWSDMVGGENANQVLA